jgi:hypothetical protein
MHEDFAKATIKAVEITNDVEFDTAIDILAMCKGIQNLSLVVDGDDYCDKVTSLLKHIDTLPLRVLSFQAHVPLTSALISDITVFAKLTHLEVDICRMFQNVDLQYVPQLTHIAMFHTKNIPISQAPSLIRRLLDHAPLQVLIIRVVYHREFADFLDSHGLHDRRIVVATSKLYMWDDLGRASMLLWEVAEALVKLPEPNHSTSM